MKYALCVGNNYPGTDAELSGCVNDAYDWAELLARMGYTANVHLEAGAAETLNMLQMLVRGLRWGDRLVFTYSGHGTWVNDLDGDEEDLRDEALYMADGNLLLDDEIQKVFAELPYGTGGLILSDSCFSGTVSRNLIDAPRDFDKARFYSPSRFTGMTDNEAKLAEVRTSVKGPRKTASLISGCSDTEYSYDAWFGERANGAFTRWAIDAYLPGDSLARWFNRIRTALPNARYPQTPQLTSQSLYRRYAQAL